ncbi:MAG: hypothetical protein LBQ41_01440 [Candidatus Ancillula sp.]|jgi:predicted nucleic acid-binding protein|nr:hypothetical protein [Candidatus Ancillula sp.]
MKVLLDTNILIPLENSSNKLDPELAQIVRLTSEQNINLVVHPLQYDDVSNDKDQERRDNLLSHLEKYEKIDSPPVWSEDDAREFKIKEGKSNDKIDNNLLYSAFRNAVTFLVTEDREIHKKARIFGIEERVFYSSTFLGYLKNNSAKEPCPPIGIEACNMHELKVEDIFFESLRKSYNGFDDWFAKSAREGRKAWRVVGIVEKTFHSADPEIVWQEIAKRTVYTRDHVDEIAEKNTLVILFRLVEYMPSPKTLDQLISNGNVTAALQTIQELRGDM